jgi:hypothetical protein
LWLGAPTGGGLPQGARAHHPTTRQVGEHQCLWADDFAHAVVATALSALILFVDMERDRATSPYRVLASAPHPTRAILLKRQGCVYSLFCFSLAIFLF